MRLFLYKISIVVSFSLCFLACSKSENDVKTNFDLTEIVQTDSLGNVLNTNELDDWTQFEQDENINFVELYSSLTYQYVNGEFQNIPYQNCGVNDSISLIVFQNPVPQNSHPILKINSNVEIIDLGLTTDILGTSEAYIDGGVGYYLDGDDYDIEIPLNEFLSNYPESDFTIFCLLVTADSCTYYTQGNVKFD